MASKRRGRANGRGSVSSYSTKSGTRWQWQYWTNEVPGDEDTKRVRVTGGGFSTKAAAEDALDAKRRELETAWKLNRGSVPKLGPYVRDWLEGQRLAPSTRHGYDGILTRYVEPELGAIPLDKIRPGRLATFYAMLRKSGGKDGRELSANTVRKVHVLVGSILEAAIDDGHVQVNAARRATVAKPPTRKEVATAAPEVKAWSADELNTFLQWDRDVLDDTDYALWVTLAHTGMRRGEALGLRWGDIDVKGRRVSVRRAADSVELGKTKPTKNGKPRVVDVGAAVISALKARKAALGALSLDLARKDAPVFGNLDGTVQNPNAVTARWALRMGAVKRANLEVPRISLHDLRHTHATLLLAAGEHPKVVQERLGHSDISVAMNTYSHVTPTMQRAAVDRFEAALGAD